MTTALPLLAAGLFFVRLGLMVTLHVVTSPYDPVRDAFSDYAVGPTHRLATAASLVNAAGWASLAVAVYVDTPPWSYRIVATVLLAVLTVLSVLVVAVPTDLAKGPRTARGIAHYLVAVATFGVAYSLTGDTSRWALANVGGAVGGILAVLHWVALAGLVGLCAGLLVTRLRRWFGALERVFLFTVAAFYLLFSVALALTATG